MSQPRVILYARFSGERQNPLSARDQISACERRAAREGWRVVDRLTDEAMSGAVTDRPSYQALRNAIIDRRADIILAESLDRLSRDQEETANLFKLCRFYEVDIVTLSEGTISELHVGLSSTINAIYLKQLAEKTRRGLEGRVTEGKSGGGKAYGYRVRTLPSGLPEKGELEVVEEEADIIRRIFREYAAGASPRSVVNALNAEAVPSPGKAGWAANTLQGNRERGTGILNNELYVGRRIWNRLRYVRKPGTKQRVSRLNPRESWLIDEVPHLRIVEDDLWQAVKARQARIDEKRSAAERGDKNRLSGAQATRRTAHLLSGLIHCGCCGGKMIIGGGTPARYYCSNAREKGAAVCAGMPGIKKRILETTVLGGIRDHLMQPDAVGAFIASYRSHLTDLSAGHRERHARLRKTLSGVQREIDNVMSAVKAGIITESTRDELLALEARKKTLSAELDSATTDLPDLPDNLADIYRAKVESLIESLNQPETRLQASEAIRAMVDKIVLSWNPDDKIHMVEIVGELAALLSAGNKKNAATLKAAASSLKLVAGAGFEPATFRL